MSTYDRNALMEALSIDEGVRSKPYVDTVGKTSIGVGRNLTDVGLSADEIALMLQNDVNRAEAALDRNLPWWRQLDPIRQLVLMNCCFNMGIGTLLTFVNTLAALKRGDYAAAADGMKASKWAGQVGARATRLIAMMRFGVMQ